MQNIQLVQIGEDDEDSKQYPDDFRPSQGRFKHLRIESGGQYGQLFHDYASGDRPYEGSSPRDQQPEGEAEYVDGGRNKGNQSFNHSRLQGMQASEDDTVSPRQINDTKATIVDPLFKQEQHTLTEKVNPLQSNFESMDKGVRKRNKSDARRNQYQSVKGGKNNLLMRSNDTISDDSSDNHPPVFKNPQQMGRMIENRSNPSYSSFSKRVNPPEDTSEEKHQSQRSFKSQKAKTEAGAADFRSSKILPEKSSQQKARQSSHSLAATQDQVDENSNHSLNENRPLKPSNSQLMQKSLKTHLLRSNQSLRSMIKYKRRADKTFDDSDSNDDMATQAEEDFSFEAESKNARISKLQSQEIKLERELSRVRGMKDTEKQKVALSQNTDQDIKPNKRFKNYSDLFMNMTKSMNIATLYPLVHVMITYNSKYAVTVTKKNNREYWVKMYDLESYTMAFDEKIGGKAEDYIKLKEVEQNSTGDYYAIAYHNDGVFFVRTFSDRKRKPEEIEKEELNVNQQLGLNNHTMPIDNFCDPFITCTFTNSELLYLNLFHTATLTHHHFFYNHKTREISGQQRVKLQCNKQNFPFKCFYNSDSNEIYSFYRQGHSFRIPVTQLTTRGSHSERPDYDYIEEKVCDRDLGDMYLINNKALVVRCSAQILFFKLQTDSFTNEKKWNNYYTLDRKGFVYFIKGNKRIQVTTPENIYFYIINPDTLIPELENVMWNYMNCTQMMFGSKVRYCITYKSNQKSFDVYRRKYEHSFNSNIVQENLCGSRGLPVESMNAFLVSQGNKIMFHDLDTFVEKKDQGLEIPVLQSTTREINEIISMQISQCEEQMAIISGKNLNMNEQKPNQLFLFQRQRTIGGQNDSFQHVKRIIIKDFECFDKFSMQFYYKQCKEGRLDNLGTLIFAKMDKIFEFNCLTYQARDLCHFEIPLQRQPEFFLMNYEQTISIIASVDDGIWFDHETRESIDLDQAFKISNIREIIHDSEDNAFYILSNKYQERLGLFLIRFDEKEPLRHGKHKFVIKWKNKLNIADADVQIIRDQSKQYKELLISYKTIYMNTFTVMIFDISVDEMPMIFRHESFQLWESQISGFYVKKTKDFVTINVQGINVLSFGSQASKSIVAQPSKQEKMVHSLDSMLYLRNDTKNFIYFDFATGNKTICIIQQFEKGGKGETETQFENIYKIRIYDITLRELIIFQSIYVCNTQSDILKLVEAQPKPDLFYKAFLELDATNMASILSFDSKSMKCLLADKNQEYFSSEYPLFYKNKIHKSNNHEKYFYRSAISQALRSNQIRAVGCIIDYIVKYQNNYSSSYLLTKTFYALLEKGVQVSDLLNSNIFCYTFDYDEWPSTHTIDDEIMRPYNGSIFELRYKYDQIFKDIEHAGHQEDLEEVDSRKIFKVSYSINHLPMLGEYVKQDEGETGKRIENGHISLMDQCIESGQVQIFNSQNFQNLIRFKWETFARKDHYMGFFFHLMYVVATILYINEIYILNASDNYVLYDTMIAVAIIYPAVYDWTQMYRIGLTSYLSDINNYFDMIYISSSIANVFVQRAGLYREFIAKVLMTVIILTQIVKTFFFLRIFEKLSYIVTMIAQVMSDLKVFLLFYGILIVLFAQILAVLGLANENQPGLPGEDGGFQQFYYDVYGDDPVMEEPENFPNEEYQMIGKEAGYILSVLRYSLGDFDFEASTWLTPAENYLYFIIWLLIVGITCIIFLNFIIAETAASYDTVKQNLVAEVYRERAQLIAEAESMKFEYFKNNRIFPKYMILRKIDT